EGFVAVLLVPADPELALVPALAVAAARRHGVALDRLVAEGRAFGRPVLQGAGLEVEVERLAVRPHGQDACVGGRLGGGEEGEGENRCVHPVLGEWEGTCPVGGYSP